MGFMWFKMTIFVLVHRAFTCFGVMTMVVATSELGLKSYKGQGIPSSPS